MGNSEWEAGAEEDSFFEGFSEGHNDRSIKDHRDLIVWQAAMVFAQAIYQETSEFPREEIYGLTSQIRRAAVSISSNIAEGYGRGATGAYVQFLRIAQGSARESHSLLELSRRLGYLTSDTHDKLEADITRILNMLGSLIRKLQNKA